MGLTIHSSRSRFAARLNSGVRPHFEKTVLDPNKILAGARSTVTFRPEALVRELNAYGEIEAAEKLVRLGPLAIAAIGVLASRHLSSPANLMIDTAICLGVVEFLEEQARPLRRKRRVYPKGAPGEV